jgi:hypothetical protein
VTRLLDGAWFDEWLVRSRIEARIVAYADKRAGQRLESMDARFSSWRRRYPRVDAGDRPTDWGDGALGAVRARAARLEEAVCGSAGVAPREVRRLRWTSAALRAADGSR